MWCFVGETSKNPETLTDRGLRIIKSRDYANPILLSGSESCDLDLHLPFRKLDAKINLDWLN